MEILIEIDHGSALLSETFISNVCEFAMDKMDLPQGSELSVTFVDNEYMAELNATYRGKTGPTDVLSFECDNIDDGFPKNPEDQDDATFYSLGDIVIASDVVSSQAKEYGTTFEHELALLLIHGVLHLCGYDHVEDDDAEIMEAYQQSILSEAEMHFEEWTV